MKKKYPLFIPRYREESFAYIVSLENGEMNFYDKKCKDLLTKGQFDKISKYSLLDLDDILSDKKSKIHKKNLHKSILNKKNPLKSPISVSIELTKACNLKCTHCSVNAGEKRNRELTTKEVKKILDELKKLEVFSVFFTGGECTLRKDLIELCNYADKLDLDFFIQTNGINLSEELLKKFPKNSYFVISFDGINNCNKLHPSRFSFRDYDKVFRLLRKYRFNFSVQYVAYKHNLKDLPETYEYCRKNKIDMGALDLFATGRLLDNMGLFPTIEQIEEFRLIARAKYKYEKAQQKFESEIFSNCPNLYHFAFIQKLQEMFRRIYSGVFAAYIDSQGDVYPDVMHAGMQMFKAGNVLKNSFKYIWNNSFKKIRELVLWKNWKHCNDCILKNEYCDFKMPVLSYNLHKKYTYCGAPESQIKIMEMRIKDREKSKNAYSNDKAREIDFW